MTKKVKLFSIVNSDKFFCIVVSKERYFFEWLGSLFSKGFNGEVSDGVSYYEEIKENNKIIRKKKKIEEQVDRHESYEIEGGKLEVFYGKEKVFITAYVPVKLKKVLWTS